MKKISIIIVLLVFAVTLFGCKKPKDELVEDPLTMGFNVKNYDLGTEDKVDYVYFDVVITLNKKANVKCDVGVAFDDKEYLTSDSIVYIPESKHVQTIDQEFDKGESTVTVKVALTEENYKKSIYVCLDNKSTETGGYAGGVYLRSIVSIADAVKDGKDDNHISRRILAKINEIEVSDIKLELDKDKKTASAIGAGYQLTPTFSEDETRIEIIFSEKAKLTKDFLDLDVFVNGEAAQGKLEIKDDKYYYVEEEPTIKELSIELDYLKHYDSKETDLYKAEMSNPEYNKITVTITLKNDNKFSSNFKLTLNDKLIDSSKYKIEENILTYIFDDPNWSEFF